MNGNILGLYPCTKKLMVLRGKECALNAGKFKSNLYLIHIGKQPNLVEKKRHSYQYSPL